LGGAEQMNVTIPVFRHGINETSVFMGLLLGDDLVDIYRRFGDNLSVQFSRVKHSQTRLEH
jgi:hypothetical protein